MNFSQKYVAEALGIHQSNISDWENNVSRPEYEKLIQLAELYNVTLYQLLGIDDPFFRWYENEYCNLFLFFYSIKSKTASNEKLLALILGYISFDGFEGGFFEAGYLRLWNPDFFGNFRLRFAFIVPQK